MIHNNIIQNDDFCEYDLLSDIGFHLGNMTVANGIVFKNTSFVPARDSPDESTFYNIKLVHAYDFCGDIGFIFGKSDIADDTSNHAPFDVPINILKNNGNFNFGNDISDFVPSQDSPDEGTYKYSKLSTTSILISDFSLGNDISGFFPAWDSPDEGTCD